MADTEVSIILRAVDKVSGVMSGINKSIDKVNKSPLGQITQQLTGFNLSALGAVGGVTMLIKQVGKAVTETVDYNSQVKDTARLLGLDVEQTSRLIQASDDLFLSQDTLKTGLQAATRQGIDVSIDGLKRLSDQYLALNPGVERSQFLLKTFGRSGADLYKLMEVGSQGIDKAMASVENSLVVTDKSIAASDEYKRNLDKLSDSWTGLKIAVGNGVIPILNAFLSTEDDLNKVELGNIRMQERAVEEAIRRGIMVDENTKKLALLKLAEQQVVDAIDADNLATANNAKLQADAAASAEALAEASKARQSYYNNITSLATNLHKAEDDLKTAETDLYDYQKSHPWDTKGISDRQTAVDNLKVAQQQMVDQWMLNVYTQMLTADGDLSASDMQFLLDYQVNTGMISQQNANRAMDYYDYARQVMDRNKAMQDSLDSLHGPTVHVQIIYDDPGWNPPSQSSPGTGGSSGHQPTQPVGGYASGADFIVPPGYPNDSYPMRVQSGERVTVTPAGQSQQGITATQLEAMMSRSETRIVAALQKVLA